MSAYFQDGFSLFFLRKTVRQICTFYPFSSGNGSCLSLVHDSMKKPLDKITPSSFSAPGITDLSKKSAHNLIKADFKDLCAAAEGQIGLTKKSGAALRSLHRNQLTENDGMTGSLKSKVMPPVAGKISVCAGLNTDGLLPPCQLFFT